MNRAQSLIKCLFAASAAGLLLLLFIFMGATPSAVDLEAHGYDLLVHLGSRAAPRPDIVVVDFDNAFLQQLHRFPVPRGVVAQVVEQVSAAHPDLIGFDMLLSERRSPDEDKRLSTAINAAGNVLLATQLGSDDIPVSDPLPEYCVLDPQSPSNCKQGAALGAGFINMPIDGDGFVRRLFLLPPQGYPVLPFSVVVATNYLRTPLTPCGPDVVCLGTRRIYMDGDALHTALVDWPATLPRVVPAGELLAGKVPTAALAGKIVLIGQSSTAGNDLHFTPQFRFRQADDGRHLMPGTLIHAAAIQTLLDGTAIRPMSFPLRTAYFALCLALALFLIVLVPPRFSLIGLALLVFAVFAAAWALFEFHQVWNPFVLSELGIVSTLPVGFGFRFVEERWLKGHAERERLELMAIFSRYVSPEAAAEIWSRRGEITLAGEERDATVMFTDIRNFTAITAGKPPGEVLFWLNDYLTEMSAVIEEHDGFLNKFIGDGIMVLFGVPLSAGPAQDATHALRTALGMLARVKQWNGKHRGDPRFPEIEIGIGIHSGRVTAGNVGSRTRLEYSVIGAAVNLASRLESLTKELHVPVILTAETEALVLGRFVIRDLGEAAVRGFEDKIRVYTVDGVGPDAGSSKEG